jgi:glycerate kinase
LHDIQPTHALKLLLTFDKFRGSLTAHQACQAFAEGVREVLPNASIVERPLSDGGEQSARLLTEAFGGQWQRTQARNPLGQHVQAGWGWLSSRQTAVLDMAEAAGQQRLEAGTKQPMRASTQGVGDLLSEALQAGARQIWLGLGGSATQDCGLGMAEALGWRFYDATGALVKPTPWNMTQISEAEAPQAFAGGFPAQVTALCDVRHKLLGENGARAFARQKGGSLGQRRLLEAGLHAFSRLMHRKGRGELRYPPGSGAAGGLGAGAAFFLDAELCNGAAFISEVLELDKLIEQAGHVVAGEGRLDAASFRGKAVGEVALRCERLGKPLHLVVGQNQIPENELHQRRIIRSCHSLSSDPVNVAYSIAQGFALMKNLGCHWAYKLAKNQ